MKQLHTSSCCFRRSILMIPSSPLPVRPYLAPPLRPATAGRSDSSSAPLSVVRFASFPPAPNTRYLLTSRTTIVWQRLRWCSCASLPGTLSRPHHHNYRLREPDACLDQRTAEIQASSRLEDSTRCTSSGRCAARVAEPRMARRFVE